MHHLQGNSVRRSGFQRAGEGVRGGERVDGHGEAMPVTEPSPVPEHKFVLVSDSLARKQFFPIIPETIRESRLHTYEWGGFLGRLHFQPEGS